MRMYLHRKLAGEALGTLLLLTTVIGSGIMAERLAGGNFAIALLANTLATVGGLYILIEVFGPISGAHLNPAVSTVMAWRGELPKTLLVPYVAAQLLGSLLGAWLAHAMFGAVALVYNWWSWYVRAANPEARREALTSRPLLLAAVGRSVKHAGQTLLYLTPMHAETDLIKSMIANVQAAVRHVRAAAEQLPKLDRWTSLLAYICRQIVGPPTLPTPPPALPAGG